MSRDLRNAPLHLQAAQLQKSLENREKRRNADRAHRVANAEQQGTFDIYEDATKRQRGNAGHGAPGSSAIQALAAISATSGAHQPEVRRCDICQANFMSDAQYQQHLQGPVHRKAVQKLEDERARQERMAMYNDVAQAALGAAAWQSTHGSTHSRTGGAHGTATGGRGPRHHANQHQQQQQQQSRHQQHQSQQQQQAGPVPPPVRHDLLSHEELVAQARAEEEPLSIDGWVPPSVGMTSAIPSSSTLHGKAAAHQARSQAAAAPEEAEEGSLHKPQGQGTGTGTATARDGRDARLHNSKQVDDGSASGDDEDGGAGGGLLGLNYSGDSDGGGSGSGGSRGSSDEESDGPPVTSFF